MLALLLTPGFEDSGMGTLLWIALIDLSLAEWQMDIDAYSLEFGANSQDTATLLRPGAGL